MPQRGEEGGGEGERLERERLEGERPAAFSTRPKRRGPQAIYPPGAALPSALCSDPQSGGDWGDARFWFRSTHSVSARIGPTGNVGPLFPQMFPQPLFSARQWSRGYVRGGYE